MSSHPLRITHVVTNANFAGTERYVATVSNELVRRGHRVTVVGGDDAIMPRELHDARWLPGATTKTALSALTGVGRQDIVHSHIAKSDYIALAISPLTRGRRVSTRHITAPRGFRQPIRLLGRAVRQALACEIAVSGWTSDQLARPADVVLLNGVPEADGPGTSRDKVVLMAQRLAPEKDTMTGLRAWAASRLRENGWRLQVAGSGELAGNVAQAIRDLGVEESVEQLGWVGDLGDRLDRAGIFLAPAPTEPCGLTILEAMAHATPVVAARAGGNIETVGSCPGAAMFAAGDFEGAASLLDQLGASEDRRDDYGLQLQVLQRKRFSIGSHVDGLIGVYHRALGDAREVRAC